MKAIAVSDVEAYANNILIDSCGPIPSPTLLAERLTTLPTLPRSPGTVERHVRLHQISSVSSLHIPTPMGIEIATSIDLMLRQGYVARNPTKVEAWKNIYLGTSSFQATSARAQAAAVVGISGSGKTVSVDLPLRFYPQTWTHATFPNLIGPFKQVLWLKVDVPESGKTIDFAEQLMIALDNALDSDHFSQALSSSRKRGSEMLRSWLQKAKSHFLGLLVLDEIQNFFKIETKRRRESSKTRSDERPELRIVDDELLKFVLTLTNTSGIPLLAIGTPDGMAAFFTRFSTAQRLLTGGFHHMQHFTTHEDPYFKKYLFPRLCNYQWFEKRLRPSDQLRSHLYDLTGGVPRIVSSLWIHAQRCALERDADMLELRDFDRAMHTYMAPLVPAISALKSNDPRRLSKYEDLLPNGNTPWGEMR